MHQLDLRPVPERPLDQAKIGGVIFDAQHQRGSRGSHVAAQHVKIAAALAGVAFGARERQLDPERGATANLALHSNPAGHGLRKPLAQRQADSSSFHRGMLRA